MGVFGGGRFTFDLQQSPIFEEARIDDWIGDFFGGRVDTDPIKFDFEVVSSFVLDIKAYLKVAGRNRDLDLWLLDLK